MARGMVVGEAIVSQAQTKNFDEGYERTFGARKPQRGRWVMTPEGLVSAENYVPEPRAIDAPIIADRIHEGTTFDAGDRVIDIGSRQKRRQFLRDTGLADATDCSRSWLESQAKQRERTVERRIDASAEQAARKLYQQGKFKE